MGETINAGVSQDLVTRDSQPTQAAGGFRRGGALPGSAFEGAGLWAWWLSAPYGPGGGAREKTGLGTVQLPKASAAVDLAGAPDLSRFVSVPGACTAGNETARRGTLVLLGGPANPEKRAAHLRVRPRWTPDARAGAAGMSDARKGPDEADDGQCDSGIESLRSLRSLPEPAASPGSGPSHRGCPQPWSHPPETHKEPGEKEDADGERADSTYASSSLTESLPLLGRPEVEDPAPDSPLPHTEVLSPQQLEALTYISEDGDT